MSFARDQLVVLPDVRLLFNVESTSSIQSYVGSKRITTPAELNTLFAVDTALTTSALVVQALDMQFERAASSSRRMTWSRRFTICGSACVSVAEAGSSP